MNCHFIPVGKPAPPRPRRLDSLTSAIRSVRLHRQRLAQPGVAVQPLVVGDLPRLVGAEALREDRRQRLTSVSSRWSGLDARRRTARWSAVRRSRSSAAPGRCGAASPARASRSSPRGIRRRGVATLRARARRRSRSGTPLPLASRASAASSKKPAICRSICRKVHSGAPRVGAGRSPARSWSTSSVADSTRLVVEELVVDGDHRCVVAGGKALGVFEGDRAVGCRLVVADAERLLQRAEDLVAADHPAQRVGADADEVLTGRRALVHRVERRHGRHLRLGQVQHARRRTRCRRR